MSIKGYFENLRYEREKQQRKESAIKILSGLAIGALIGGVVGVLYAPKAGKETRHEIAEKVKETAAATREKVKETVKEVKEKVDDLKDKRVAVVDKTTDSKNAVKESGEVLTAAKRDGKNKI
ncbi:MAG: YtxH domain-containing protein [Bacillota bacterium]|nr:YtxH domain-containing protein [Bacillota bacterium]